RHRNISVRRSREPIAGLTRGSKVLFGLYGAWPEASNNLGAARARNPREGDRARGYYLEETHHRGDRNQWGRPIGTGARAGTPAVRARGGRDDVRRVAPGMVH